MSEPRQYITQLFLPYWTFEDELDYMSMSLTTADGVVDRRQAFRIMRQWYKDHIGRSVPKEVLIRVWRRRTTSLGLTEQDMAEQLHRMASRLDEAAKGVGDPGGTNEETT